ncbi:MAG: non-hydrolyzing UDP-N-acetylglucosamine 2-epimerase [Thermodesulfobacteriota bacterium]
MKVLLVAGARPNFMKIAPIYRESKARSLVDCRIVHTGQHYDYDMSQTFFNDLELPQPVHFLNAGSGSHAVQTARIMVEFEKVCEQEKPDLVMVVGDVNSTLACSVVAKKLGIQVAHVEAGLRSFDLQMPEEINRMVTDVLSDFLFVTEESGRNNLVREGKSESRIHFVGNVMVDNLLHQNARLNQESERTFETATLKKQNPGYAFLTLHRPSNVDDREKFMEIASALNTIAGERPILFPIHPRTAKMKETFGIRFAEGIHLLSPLGFREALFLWKDAAVVLTDSGGLQEETTALGVPCVTIRDNTERPITIEQGTNILAGTSKDGILKAYRESQTRDMKDRRLPPKWDGKASKRIWDIVAP